MKISKQKVESFNHRVKKIDEGIDELGKVANCTKIFYERLHFDKQKIRDIDTRVMV